MEGLTNRDGTDFSVRVKRKNNSNAINVYLSVKDKFWKKITVTYLLSSRDDLLVGSFIADTFGVFGCDSLGTGQNEIR